MNFTNYKSYISKIMHLKLIYFQLRYKSSLINRIQQENKLFPRICNPNKTFMNYKL